MIRILILITLLLTSCVQAPVPPAPVTTPSPVPAPVASPARGPLYCLVLAHPPPDVSFLRAVFSAEEAWNRALGYPVFSWHEGRPVRLMQADKVTRALQSIIGGVTFPEAGIVVFSSEVPAGKRLMVAAHELGHAIGIKHSDNPDDLMYPTGNTTGNITPDDVCRAQAALADGKPVINCQAQD